LPFSALQLRLNRKAVAPMLFPDVPVRFIAYDLLEDGGTDVRALPLDERVSRLMRHVAALDDPANIAVAPPVEAGSWDALAETRESARERGVEGLMLKRLSSAYSAGRTRGDWWKWKVDPLIIDAVMTHAQHGSGIRAGLYTDYTFGLWNAGELVTIAKAYSGLTNEEITEVDAFVRNNTISRHGPVRMVLPTLVFELAFDAVQESTRHKSGLALRFPRMNRWRRDKPASQADSVDALRALYRASPR
jgi:DNA ligase-1